MNRYFLQPVSASFSRHLSNPHAQLQLVKRLRNCMVALTVVFVCMLAIDGWLYASRGVSSLSTTSHIIPCILFVGVAIHLQRRRRWLEVLTRLLHQ